MQINKSRDLDIYILIMFSLFMKTPHTCNC